MVSHNKSWSVDRQEQSSRELQEALRFAGEGQPSCRRAGVMADGLGSDQQLVTDGEVMGKEMCKQWFNYG